MRWLYHRVWRLPESTIKQLFLQNKNKWQFEPWTHFQCGAEVIHIGLLRVDQLIYNVLRWVEKQSKQKKQKKERKLVPDWLLCAFLQWEYIFHGGYTPPPLTKKTKNKNKLTNHNKAFFTWVLRIIRIYICFFCYWTKRLGPLCHPIRGEINTNRDPLAHVFPRFARNARICNELWLVHWIAYVVCDWPEWLLRF